MSLKDKGQMSKYEQGGCQVFTDNERRSVIDWNCISLTVASASLLIPFKLVDADDDWDEVTEQLQAIQWGDGMGVAGK